MKRHSISADVYPVEKSLMSRSSLTENISRSSVNNLWTICAEEHWNRGRQWDREARRLFVVHIGPRIGTKKVKDLNYRDVNRIRTALSDTPNQANRVIAVLSKMLNLAERMEMRPIGSNPCKVLPRFREQRRRRYATPEEIGRLGPLLEAEGYKNPAAAAFLYLLLFSGARPSEIARARWDQLDGAVLRIPEGKTGERTVFLPRQAVEVLSRIPRTSETITGLSAVPKKVWGRIRAAAGCPDLYARDLRRTFATIGLSNGVPIGAVGELLGHKSADTTKIYAKLLEGRAAEATAIIADKIEGLLTISQ